MAKILKNHFFQIKKKDKWKNLELKYFGNDKKAVAQFFRELEMIIIRCLDDAEEKLKEVWKKIKTRFDKKRVAAVDKILKSEFKLSTCNKINKCLPSQLEGEHIHVHFLDINIVYKMNLSAELQNLCERTIKNNEIYKQLPDNYKSIYYDIMQYNLHCDCYNMLSIQDKGKVVSYKEFIGETKIIKKRGIPSVIVELTSEKSFFDNVTNLVAEYGDNKFHNIEIYYSDDKKKLYVVIASMNTEELKPEDKLRIMFLKNRKIRCIDVSPTEFI